MNKQTILSKVHTRTYYIAESKKDEIPSVYKMQTSSDNADILSDYMDSAINELKFYMDERLDNFVWDDDGNIKVESKRPKSDILSARLDESISDYLVEELVYRWVSDNIPKLADGRDRDRKLEHVKDIVSSLSPIVRRRATTMGV